MITSSYSFALFWCSPSVCRKIIAINDNPTELLFTFMQLKIMHSIKVFYKIDAIRSVIGIGILIGLLIIGTADTKDCIKALLVSPWRRMALIKYTAKS